MCTVPVTVRVTPSDFADDVKRVAAEAPAGPRRSATTAETPAATHARWTSDQCNDIPGAYPPREAGGGRGMSGRRRRSDATCGLLVVLFGLVHLLEEVRERV